jgi:hypothetical protein
MTEPDGSLWLLDIDMGTLVPSYPKMNDNAFIMQCRLYYMLKGIRPTASEFDTPLKDDGKVETYYFGPITVLYAPKKKQEAADAAIFEFIHEHLQLGGEHDELPACNFSSDMCKQSFYIVWKKWGKETFLEMQQRFHQHESALRVDNFLVVGRRQLNDCIVCLHNKNELGNEWKKDDDPVNFAKISMLHITKCLCKDDVILPDRCLPDIHPWRRAFSHDPNKMLRVPEYGSVWHMHPYFSRYFKDKEGRVVYQPGRDWLFLTEEEQERLPSRYRDIYQAVVNKMVNPSQLDELTAFLKTAVNKLHTTYEKFSYDTFEFVMHSNFLVPELLKIFVNPPPPRARPESSVSLELKSNLNNYLCQARLIPKIIHLCTNKKSKAKTKPRTTTTATSNKVVLIIKRNDDKFEEFLRGFPVFVEHNKQVELDNGDQCYVLESERVIYQFLNMLSTRLFYPIESIISHVPETLEKKDDPRHKCFGCGNQGFVNSLSLASLSVPKIIHHTDSKKQLFIKLEQ